MHCRSDAASALGMFVVSSLWAGASVRLAIISVNICRAAQPPTCWQGVAWTGALNSRRVALGVKVNWAYAPGEVKILTSSDGANFEEAKCWQSSTRGEVAFEESFMFDAPRSFKAEMITVSSP